MAVRRKLANVADMMLKQYMQRRQAEYESQLIQQRQQEAAQQQFEFSTLGRIQQDPALAQRLLKSGRDKIGSFNTQDFIPTEEEAIGGAAKELAGISDLQKLPTQLDIEMSTRGRPGFPQQDPTPIGDLIRQRTQREAAIKGGTTRVPIEEMLPTGAKQSRYINPETQDAPIPTGLGIVEQGGLEDQAKRATLTTLGPALAAQQGREAGASAAAQYPWQQKLAQTHADISLLNQQEMDDYRREHPKATAEQVNRREKAQVALNSIADVRTMLGEMETRGMTGALLGRAAKLATGEIKSESLFANPTDAQLAGEFFSTIGLLTSLTANVHSGMRGAGSPTMLKYFQSLINGIGDVSITTGQLDALERLMQQYKDHPDAPAELPIPGYTAGRVDPRTPLDPTIQQLLDRSKGR